MRNHISAAMPVKANPKTNAGCRHNRISDDTEGLNPSAAMMPFFINKFATDMQSAVITKSVKPARVKVYLLRTHPEEMAGRKKSTIPSETTKDFLSSTSRRPSLKSPRPHPGSVCRYALKIGVVLNGQDCGNPGC